MLEQLAEELVQMTSALVSGRIINVMNHEGVIIASTERERIGTVHEGARRVLKTGRTVKITKEQIPLYPGAKEGCNMPLRMNGKIIGVVGIYGNPEEIQDLAQLLEVYAGKYFELETIIYQRMQENELRCRLMRRLVSKNGVSIKCIQSFMDDLRIRMFPPFQVAVISGEPDDSRLIGNDKTREIVLSLVKEKLVNPDTDLYCTDNGKIYFFKSRVSEQDRQYWSLFQTALQRFGKYRLSLGSICGDWNGVRESYLEACSLDRCSSKDFNEISSPVMRCLYEMDTTLMNHEDHFSEIYHRLKENFKQEDMDVLLLSAECYYEEERSITRAAARLFIHKNTLQYRIHRLLEAMDLSGQPVFYQEYLVRLILQYHRNNLPKRDSGN